MNANVTLHSKNEQLSKTAVHDFIVIVDNFRNEIDSSFYSYIDKAMKHRTGYNKSVGISRVFK